MSKDIKEESNSENTFDAVWYFDSEVYDELEPESRFQIILGILQLASQELIKFNLAQNIPKA